MTHIHAIDISAWPNEMAFSPITVNVYRGPTHKSHTYYNPTVHSLRRVVRVQAAIIVKREQQKVTP